MQYMRLIAFLTVAGSTKSMATFAKPSNPYVFTTAVSNSESLFLYWNGCDTRFVRETEFHVQGVEPGACDKAEFHTVFRRLVV